MFSIVIPGSTTFPAPAQAGFCAAITSVFQGPGFNSTCTISGVTSFNGTAAIVNGFAASQWSATPTVTQLSVASSLRDSVVSALISNTTSVLPGFTGATANCACNGVSAVTAFSTATTAYSTNVTLPGPMQCGAKLTFASAAAVTNQVGVDDGSTNALNKGKYCSTPAVAGGVVGVPGAGSCIQYGVIAGAVGSVQAIAGTVTVTGGQVTAIATSGGFGNGAGYTSAPAVTISAPSQVPAQLTVTVSSIGGASFSVSPAVNGPYAAVPTVTGFSGGPCVSAGCSGAVIQIVGVNLNTLITGPQCTAADVNVLNAGTTPILSVSTSTTGALGKATAPSTWVCTPGIPPVFTLSTNTLQPAVTATAIATLATDGSVNGITITNPGSGYLSTPLPTVTIAPPGTDNTGKLCSLNPISGLDPAMSSVGFPVPTGVSTTGQCQPIGRDTVANVPCSIPAAPKGIYSPINVGTCNVASSFIVQPGSTTTSTCGVLAQSFITSVAASPAKPPTPAPGPGPTPTSAPTPTPSPTPTFRGRFQIGSVACKGKFLAASGSCGDKLVYLRTTSQSKGSRTFWAIDGTAGVATGVTSVVRVGKCNGNTNLASAQSTPTPVIGGGSWKVILTPVDPATPNVVTIAATDKTYKGKYLQVGDKCDDQKGFSWAAKSSSTGQQWTVVSVSSIQ